MYTDGALFGHTNELMRLRDAVEPPPDAASPCAREVAYLPGKRWGHTTTRSLPGRNRHPLACVTLRTIGRKVT